MKHKTIFATLIFIASIIFAIPASAPHENWKWFPKRCASCHKNHTAREVPLLNMEGSTFCYQCHGEIEKLMKAKAERLIVNDISPRNIEAEFKKPYIHSLQEEFYTTSQGSVKAPGCRMCHTLHSKKVSKQNKGEYSRLLGQSTADDIRTLCLECHESSQEGQWSAMNSHNLSCTDCHGNDDANGASGVHGSHYKYILRANYVSEDGSEESEHTYALCYQCHSRKTILDGLSFSYHSLHIVNKKISCSTCHNDAHSAEVRFAPNMVFSYDGKIEWQPGIGCTLICHGVVHSRQILPAPQPAPFPDIKRPPPLKIKRKK